VIFGSGDEAAHAQELDIQTDIDEWAGGVPGVKLRMSKVGRQKLADLGKA
jgi:hypothetical protein